MRYCPFPTRYTEKGTLLKKKPSCSGSSRYYSENKFSLFFFPLILFCWTEDFWSWFTYEKQKLPTQNFCRKCSPQHLCMLFLRSLSPASTKHIFLYLVKKDPSDVVTWQCYISTSWKAFYLFFCIWKPYNSRIRPFAGLRAWRPVIGIPECSYLSQNTWMVQDSYK